MGMFDEIIATITCPCCKTTYLNEDIQTKHFACNLDKMYEGDDRRPQKDREQAVDIQHIF